MTVRLKSVYAPPDADDGVRVLTTQYWPRGIKKDLVDKYVRVLGPSRDLLHEFKNGAIGWEEYRVRYLEEMKRPEAQNAIVEVRQIASARQVTIMCICRDEDQCHRSLLRDLIANSDGANDSSHYRAQ